MSSPICAVTRNGCMNRCYCARGEMENAIKQQQLDLFADRTSCHVWWANQFRMLLSSLAYILLERLRALTLKQTALAHAYVGTIRLKLLKIGGGGDPQHTPDPLPVCQRHPASGVVQNGRGPARPGLIAPLLSWGPTRPTGRGGARPKQAPSCPKTPQLAAEAGPSPDFGSLIRRFPSDQVPSAYCT